MSGPISFNSGNTQYPTVRTKAAAGKSFIAKTFAGFGKKVDAMKAPSTGKSGDLNITPTELKQQTAQLHQELLASGVKVKSYNEKTGETVYDNGVTLYNYTQKLDSNTSESCLIAETAPDENGAQTSLSACTTEYKNGDFKENISEIVYKDGTAQTFDATLAKSSITQSSGDLSVYTLATEVTDTINVSNVAYKLDKSTQ